jgi:hypothetical protein
MKDVFATVENLAFQKFSSLNGTWPIGKKTVFKEMITERRPKHQQGNRDGR